MCDVKNPLYGKNGAAYVFAPQKGVKPGEIEMLDAGLIHLSEVIKTDLHKDISELPGSGAAGGTGGGTVAFFGSRLQSGIDTVLDAVDFESLLDTADLVITGEGKLDGQSMGGKAVIGIAERAAKKNVPVIAVVGCTGDGYEEAYKHGVKRVIATDCAGKSFEDIVKNAKQYLSDALEKNLTHDAVCDIIAGVKNE